MRKVSDALRALVEQNHFFKFGLHHRLLNLTQLARHVQPQVQARLQKDVDLGAITMNLSRLQRELGKNEPEMKDSLHIANIVVHSDLCVLAYLKAKDLHAGINRLHNRVQKTNGYLTISEGVSEVTLITDQRNVKLAEELIPVKMSYKHLDVAALGVKFEPEYLGTVGLFYRIFQQFYYQRINIIEIASAASELIIYLQEKDIQLAFDTLFSRMREEKRTET